MRVGRGGTNGGTRVGKRGTNEGLTVAARPYPPQRACHRHPALPRPLRCRAVITRQAERPGRFTTDSRTSFRRTVGRTARLFFAAAAVVSGGLTSTRRVCLPPRVHLETSRLDEGLR